ncbi:MAG: AAA family ATPase [Anaerolineales bacterium]|nr:AAA family ATPase [Anaerolineales bacterium]
MKTKLYISPPGPGLVSRPRLLQELENGLSQGRRLTLVSAPPGSGKSTLLGEWATHIRARREALQAAWLSLDQDDDDALRFWGYVIAALQEVSPDLGRGALLALRQAPPAFLISDVLTPLLNELAGMNSRVVLFLDDYHCVTERSIHEGLAYLLEHAPQQLHLALATRSDPPLPVANLRARGQLTELRAEQLRFRPHEAGEFFNQGMGLHLSAREVEALTQRSEGWIAGLQLAALSLQGRADWSEFIEAFSGAHPYIDEYLTQQVLRRQPAVIQRFLVCTSILDHLCAPLCDALLDEEDLGNMLELETGVKAPALQVSRSSQQALERLYRANLFLAPLDDQGYWYRYQPLFADLLRKRLQAEFSAGQITALHRQASAWYEHNRLWVEAAKHALQAQDAEGVARLAECAIKENLLDSRLTTLNRWLQSIPAEALEARPLLRLYNAWALYLNGRFDQAETALRAARSAMHELPPTPQGQALHRELARLLEAMDALREGLTCALNGDLERSRQHSQRALELAEEAGDIFLKAQATEGLALVEYNRGRLHAAAQLFQKVIDLAVDTGDLRGAPPLPLAAAGYIELARIQLEWNDQQVAQHHLQHAIDLCRRAGGEKTLVEALVLQSRLKLALGDLDGALQSLEQAGQIRLGEAAYSLTNFRLATQRACLNLTIGDWKKIARWVEDLERLFEKIAIPLPAVYSETLNTMQARVYLAQGQADDALLLLEPLCALAEAGGRFGALVGINLLMALAFQARGDLDTALAYLERSLALAAPGGYVRVYLDAGAAAASLLGDYCQGKPDGENLVVYARSLLLAFGDFGASVPPAPSPGVRAGVRKDELLVEPLTQRELHVLRYLASGLSTPEIADELVIAVSTVRSHVKRIYDKLGAHSRYEAVERARSLGLI